MKLFCLFFSLAWGTNPTQNPGIGLPELLKHLKTEVTSTSLSIGKEPKSHVVQVHFAPVGKKLKSEYSPRQVKEWKQFLSPALQIGVSPTGVVQAAERMESGKKDPTNYDAVWVRDSLWAYLGLSASVQTQAEAKRILVNLWDYFSSPAQIIRLKSIIADPSLLSGPNGPMNVPHIRFDGKSPDFSDVYQGGKPQKWNHKQNDALGLWLDLVVRANTENAIFTTSDWTPARLEAIALMPAYFLAVKFYDMEDAGSWEEIERTNSSSIGLVISALERVRDAKGSLLESLRKQGLLDSKSLSALIAQGYDRLNRQLAAGGESPLYPAGDPRFRQYDAALLNLIYPCRLALLTTKQKEQILKAVRPLVGEVGIRRYLGDSYQSGNFWFGGLQVPAAKKTDDTSSAANFAERGRQFLDDSEAQWFFDSWMSVATAEMYRQTKDPEYRRQQVQYFNRALGHLTGEKRLGADGRPVPGFALPESYNTVVDGESRYFAPSPITPLNWAKASLRLALESL